MNVLKCVRSRGLVWLRTTAAAVACLLAALTVGGMAAAEVQQASSDGELKWTPHRQSQGGPPAPLTTAARPRSVAPPQAARPANDSPTFGRGGPRAPIASATAEPSNPFTGPRRSDPPRARRPLPAPSMGAMLNEIIAQAPFTRAPQGEMRQPILGAEGRAAAVANGRRQRGDAPPFAGRPDRYAMASDDLPSVVNRDGERPAPEVTAEPGYEEIPSPSAGSEMFGEPMAGDSWSEPPYAGSIRGARMGGDPPPGAAMLPGGVVVSEPGVAGGMWLGEYPGYDPYGCEDDCGVFPCLPYHYHGRLCNWLRRFGKPYYGWRWYKNFSVGVGAAGFQNGPDLGLLGNYGFNEYANWAMPLWNAFGIGWQLGVRGVQANFNSSTISQGGNDLLTNHSRNQFFLTTGFFTRAFEGRGLQGGAVYDYLRDNYYDDVDVAQIRGEISYVFGAQEFGFWGTGNIKDANAIFTKRSSSRATAESIDIYAAFYRLYFGDANELKLWGGGTGSQEGIIGAFARSPMNRSLALEGAFTYVMPGPSQTIDLDGTGVNTLTFTESAWNVSINLVYYPACRSRRGLSSPYRPLMEVADNGTLIRSVKRATP